jgi:D-aminopeptidase
MHLIDKLERIGEYVDSRCADHRIPGLSVVVMYEQEPRWMHSWGFANLEQQVPATPKTIYRICSVTKVFTASIG